MSQTDPCMKNSEQEGWVTDEHVDVSKLGIFVGRQTDSAFKRALQRLRKAVQAEEHLVEVGLFL